MARKPLNKKEASKEDYKDWDDEVKLYKSRKRIKWDYKFVKVAARLVASGHTERDLGYVLGVRRCTISKWKQRYPQFAAACENGKAIAKNYLVSSGLKAACGYDYEEEFWEKKKTGEDAEGAPIYEMQLVKKTKKHQKPDASLLQFFLINMSDEFTNTKNINVTETRRNLDVRITGEIEADTIRDFAGKLLEQADAADKRKVVESKVVDAVESV